MMLISTLDAHDDLADMMNQPVMTPQPRQQIEKAAPILELLKEAKALAARYYVLTGKPLGVTGEIAELEAAEKLNLVLVEARNPDYDAVLNNGTVIERFQIKGRAVDPMDRYRGRAPSIKFDGDFEWVLLVLLDRSSFEALEIWRAGRQDVAMRLQTPGSRARNERNSMGITQFKSIARKVWPEGVENSRRRITAAPVIPRMSNKNRDDEANRNLVIATAIVRKSGRSWKNLRKACLDFQGTLVNHSTSAVGASSRTLARNVAKATNMTFDEIITMMDSYNLGTG